MCLLPQKLTSNWGILAHSLGCCCRGIPRLVGLALPLRVCHCYWPHISKPAGTAAIGLSLRCVTRVALLKFFSSVSRERGVFENAVPAPTVCGSFAIFVNMRLQSTHVTITKRSIVHCHKKRSSHRYYYILKESSPEVESLTSTTE